MRINIAALSSLYSLDLLGIRKSKVLYQSGFYMPMPILLPSTPPPPKKKQPLRLERRKEGGKNTCSQPDLWRCPTGLVQVKKCKLLLSPYSVFSQ